MDRRIREALQKIEEETWAPTPDDQRYLKIRNMARKALAELDNPASSDARELAIGFLRAVAGRMNVWVHKNLPGYPSVAMDYGKIFAPIDSSYIGQFIESFAAARERKTREETARKCAEAAVAWHKLVYPGDAHALGDTLERAIMEAAK